jgi:phosphonatase-like hydrolase
VAAHTLACLGLIGTIMVDDGTLEKAFAEAIATQGVVTGTTAFARGMARVHRARGKSSMDVLRDLFPGNEARAQAAHLAFERSLSGAVQRSGVQPVPGAGEVLEELAQSGVRICVMSSISHRQLSVFLTALGWQDRVDLVLGADDVPRGCPAPDLVLQAMLSLGVDDVRDTVVVQATDSGIQAGCRSGAGMVVAVLTGTHPAARLRRAGATHVLASVADLPAVLAGGTDPGLAASHVTAPRQAPEDSVPGQPARAEHAPDGQAQQAVRQADQARS